MPAASPIRYGIVGFGRVAQTYHLPCVERDERFELVAVCDVDVPRVRETLPTDAVVVTGDLGAFLDAGVQAISVCTPNDEHAPAVLAALDRGVAVLCEKPLASTVDVSAQLAAAADGTSGVVAAVNLPYRLHPLVARLRDVCGAGPVDVRMTIETPGARVWKAFGAWYDDVARAGGGALLDLGVHAVDTIATITGELSPTSGRADASPIESRADVDFDHRRGSARVSVDRRARRFAFAVEAATIDGVHTVDLRAGRATLDGETVAEAGAVATEVLAVEAFLDAVATGEASAAPTFADALRAERAIAAAYGVCVADGEESRPPT